MSRVYETALKIGATISKAFKGDALNAAGALKKLAEATKQLKAAEKSAAAFKKLDTEVTRAKARYDVASAALRKLEEAEQKAGGATKESTKWRKAGAREVAAAARQLDRATKAAQKNRETLQKLGVDTAKMASEQQRLARALAATERQEKALGHYEAARERLLGARSKTPLMQQAGAQFRGIATDAMFMGTAVVGATAGLAALVVRIGNAGDATAKMAKRVGIGVEALQELRYAGQREGASADEVDNAIGKMLINVGKWKVEGAGRKGGGGGGIAIPGMQSLDTGKSGGSGSSSILDPFKMLGISAAKLSKLKPEEQIGQIADAMKKLKTDADRAAVAQAIFGREGGLKLIPLLKGGAAGMAQLRKDARDLGYVLDKNAAAQAEEFNDRMLDAQMAATGLANTFGVALLPVVTDTFKQFTKWVKDNRAQLQKWVTDAAKWIETKGIPALKHIAAEAQAFGSKVLWLVNGAAKLTGGFGNLAIVLAGLRLAPLAVTLGKIGTQATKAAIAVVRYAAAARAAKAAGGGISGAGGVTAAGTALGLAAKGAMILQAGAIGYAIGTAIDQATGGKLSDTIAKGLGYLTGQDAKLKGIEDAGVRGHDLMLQRKKLERDGRIRQYQAQGMTYWQAVYAADHGGAPASLSPSSIRTGAGGGSTHIAPVVHINGSATRHDVAKGMDVAKHRTLEQFDRREAHRKRVSFGG